MARCDDSRGNHVDVIYRFRGSDITYYIEDLLYILSKLEPDLFSLRGKINLSTLSTQEARALKYSTEEERHAITYRSTDNGGSLLIENWRRDVPADRRAFWQTAYRHAVAVGGGKLDDVIASYRN